MNKSPRFFNPYVGKHYTKGIKGKKILVIGASHYCKVYDCPFFNECTNEEKKDSSKFDSCCWGYEQNGVNTKLADYTIDEIENANRTYKKFAKFISDNFLEFENCYEVWDYMAFANYIQFVLPHTDTYDYNVSERDFISFIQTVTELQPDIIIVWGDTVNQPIKSKESNQYIEDNNELIETEWYLCHMKSPDSSKRVAIVNCMHPQSRKHWYNDFPNFIKYLGKAFDE